MSCPSKHTLMQAQLQQERQFLPTLPTLAASGLHVLLGKLMADVTSCICLYKWSMLGLQVSALLSLEKGAEWSGGVSDVSASKQREGAEGEARLSVRAVQNDCRKLGLSPFMVPRVVLAQHTPLPTNASGKVLKHVVRESMLRQLNSKAPHSRL